MTVHKTKSSQLADRLGLMIVEGRLAPGTMLPSEAALCSEYRISRVILREVLWFLAAKGLLQREIYGHWQICPVCKWHLLDPKVTEWMLQSKDKDDFYLQFAQFGQCFFPAVATMAAANATQEDLDKLDENRELMRRNIERKNEYIEGSLRFIELLYSSAHNLMISCVGINLLQGLFHEACSRVSDREFAATLDLRLSGLDLCALIVEHLKGRKAEEALQATRAYFDLALRMLAEPALLSAAEDET